MGSQGGGPQEGVFTTIQEAVDEADEGDTILIPAGVFTGPGNRDVLVTKNLIIAGAGQGQTVLDAQGAGRGFLFQGAAVTTTTVLSGLTIRNGVATNGGGIALEFASPSLREIEITLCSAQSGGAIHSTPNVTWNAESLFLHDNSAELSGGAILMIIPRGSLRDSLLEDNAAEMVGGGLAIGNIPGPDGSPGVRIEGTVFRGNSAVFSGGAFYSEFADSFFVDRGIFARNTAGTTGGAINVLGDLATTVSDLVFFQNSLIAQNSAGTVGGGMRMVQGSYAVQNCTIADNDASGIAGGLFAAGDGLFLVNSILWGNTSSDPSVQLQQVNTAAVTLALALYNDVEGGVSDPTSISADPLFAGPARGDYHLSAGSPCIDKGLVALASLSSQLDIDGQQRVQGKEIDIGADERILDGGPSLFAQADAPQAR